jgi:hypothetical protein
VKTNSIKDFERLHRYYEKRAYRSLIKDFRRILKGIPYDNLSYELSDKVIALNINDAIIKGTLKNVYLEVGLKYGKHVVRDLQSETKALKPFPLFSERFIKFVTDYLLRFGGVKIVSITETLAKSVLSVIREAQEAGLSQSKMINLVRDKVNKPNFYRWQAMRIARTESLFAMNSAKVESFESNAFKVNKIWVQGGSRHPRADHSIMNGTEVPSEQSFTLPNGERAMYPGDNSLSASQTINCSCTIAYKPVRDNNGNLVMK